MNAFLSIVVCGISHFSFSSITNAQFSLDVEYNDNITTKDPVIRSKLKNFKLLPHQHMFYAVNPNKEAPNAEDRIEVYVPLPRLVIEKKKDSLRKDAYSFCKKVRSSLISARNIITTIIYFDKFRYPVGEGFQCMFLVGSTGVIKIGQWSHESEAKEMIDSNVNRRLDNYRIDGNQYFLHDAQKQTISILNIQDMSNYVPKPDSASREKKETIRIVYELLKKDALREYKAIAFQRIDKYGRYLPKEYQFSPQQYKLGANYDEFLKVYEMWYPTKTKDKINENKNRRGKGKGKEGS